jgi:hypothetical protein
VKRLVPLLALLAVAACGGTSNGGSSDEPSLKGTVYTSTQDIIGQVSNVVFCDPAGRPFAVDFAYRAQSCWYDAPDGAEVSMPVWIFASAEQQTESIPFLKHQNASLTLVQGPGWALAVDRGYARALAKTLGGEVVK